MEIFEHSDYQGTRDVYKGEVRQVKHDDSMSSLKVPTGCCVTIFEDSNFGGRHYR